MLNGIKLYLPIETQKYYVVKEISTQQMCEEQSINAIEEINILGSVNSPNIVTYYDSFISDNGNINILMEYWSKGDLCTFLENRKGAYLSEKYIWKFFIQMWLGLYHLHKNNIIHRDLKSLNVFLTRDFTVKIGDMGAAKIVEGSAESKLKSKVGTPYYLSPEVCKEQAYSHKSDIWALGWILYELCTLNKPFLADTQEQLIKNILEGNNFLR